MAKKKKTDSTDSTDSTSNININYNAAVSGMDMDSSLNQIPKGKLTYALNASVENFDNSSTSYQNELGNEFCLSFPNDYVLIGSHYIQEKSKHIFFLTNPITRDCEIGYMDNNDCVYRTYVNSKCLGWDVRFPIHKIVHKISNCSTEIFWPDNVARRYLDLENIPYILQTGSTLCNPLESQVLDCNQLKVQPNFSIPQLSVIDAITGGNNTAGTVQFAVQYSDALSNPYTSYYSITNPTPIADTQIITQNFNYSVGKSIILKIDDLDSTGQFQYFNLAVIKTVNDIASVELVGTYFIDDISKTITYTGQNQEQIKLTVNDIFEKFPYYELADDITSVQDVLVWKGLTSIDRVNYQSIASKISLQWETWRIPAKENYADEINATNLRGYLRDEVYAFEIVFLLDNGKQTDGFHIPGRLKNSNEAYPDVLNTNQDFIGDSTSEPYWKIYNTASVIGNSPQYTNDVNYKGPYEYGDFAYWESTETYPCNDEIWGDLANQPIRHHKFPDVLVSPIFESAMFTTAENMVMQNDAIFPIGVKLDVGQISTLISQSSLTSEQKQAIVGFKIIRGNRGTNKSIVAKGILRNVGEYEKEEQKFYFPNYPYNDTSEDPFLIKTNNAYEVIAEPWLVICNNSGPGKYTYQDVNTGKEITTNISAGTTKEFLSVNRPVRKGGSLIICPANFDVWFSTAENSPSGFKIKWNTPSTNGTVSSIVKTSDLYPAIAPWDSDDTKYSLTTVDGGVEVICPPSNTAPCGTLPLLTPPGNPQPLNSVLGVNYGFFSFSFNPTKSRRSTLNPKAPEQLKAFDNEKNRYRQVFNSPETSFAQPFLGNILKLESVVYGKGKAHFVEVKDNAKYKLLSEEAQIQALDSSRKIGKLTDPFNAVAMFTAYQAYLTIYINGITRKNYAYSFNSIASYDYTDAIPNGIGIKQREIDYTQYLIPGVQSVADADGIVMNNFQRESSVFIKTIEEKNDVEYTAFPFPDQTPSMLIGGVSKVVDRSRFTISSSGACATPAKEQPINVVSYYASMKNIFINQWGQIYSYDTVDTGFQKPINSSETATVFGGDTFINRFAFKTKLPFFFDNRVNAPDDSDIFYDEIGNVSYPKYWHSARSILKGYVLNGELLANIISYKAHNFDCPNDTQFIENVLDITPTTTSTTTINFNTSSIVTSASRTFYDGYFYLFAYGIPSFYCESSYNVDLRQAFNTKEGDFWPHVTNSIPDEWVQETNVSIANDNTYTYNVTFSKQNKENFFSHLPTDWENKDCFTKFPFRATYSDTQNQNADVRINNWLIYRATSQFDFPQNFGNLITLDGIQNKAILARFENKTLMYNKLATIDTSNPQAAYLGNPNMFANPAIDFAETDLGLVGTQNKFLLKIPQGQITVDAKRGQIFLITGDQAQDLTAYGSGVNRFMTDHLAFEILRWFPNVPTDNHFNGIGLHGVYDSKFDRVIFTKLDYIPIFNDIKYDEDTNTFYIESTINNLTIKTEVYLTDPEFFCNKSWTISFNFNTKSWISFHSYIPNWYIGDNNFFYSGINGCCTDIDAEDFTALVGDLNKIVTTTTTTTIPDVITTTTTIPVKPIECDLEGNIFITSCELEGTGIITVPPSTTTTICARPQGLTEFSFVSGYEITGDPVVDSTLSLQTACDALAITVTRSSDVLVNGFTVEALSLEINSVVYQDAFSNSCTFVPDGWYYTPEGQVLGFAYHVVGGVITEISSCDCGTLPEPPEVVYNIPECCGILFTDTNDVYYYNTNMNLLNVPGFTSTYGIAMTSHYLWSVTTEFLQWDITLAPFTATYNTSIPFPVGFTTSSGIIAINDETLIAIDDSVSPPNVG